MFTKRIDEVVPTCTIKLLRFIAGMMILSGTNLAVLANTSEPEITLPMAVDIAVRDNPGLGHMRARYKALLEIPSQSGALPDPTISINALNFPVTNFHRRQEPMTQLQFGITQTFPFPGTLELKEEAANFEALAASHSVDELRLQLIASVRKKWWEIYYLSHALETVRNSQGLLREFIQVAKTKYETGNGLQQDVLLAQLELSRLLDQEIKVNAMTRTQAIKLNVLMDTPGNDTINLSLNVVKSLPALPAREVFFEKADISRPLLIQKNVEIQAANSRLKLAEKSTYPGFSIGVAYGDRRGDNPPPNSSSRDNFLSIMVGMKVPIYSGRKQSRNIEQRANELQMRQYSSQDTRGLVLGDISSALTDYDRAREEFSLFEKAIIPQASQTVQSMLAGYQVDEVDFLNLVRSQITLLNYQLQYWKTFTEAKQSLARLEAAVGEETIYE